MVKWVYKSFLKGTIIIKLMDRSLLWIKLNEQWVVVSQRQFLLVLLNIIIFHRLYELIELKKGNKNIFNC